MTNVEKWGKHELSWLEIFAKKKGAMSKGHNHNIYATKRYYHFFTHIPVENQFYLNGIIYPMIQFYPINKVKWENKNRILHNLATADKEKLGDYLYLEKEENKEYKELMSNHFYEKISQRSKLYGYDSNIFFGIKNTEWLTRNKLILFHCDFMKSNKDKIEKKRLNLHKYLNKPECYIEVKSFSPNHVNILVKNVIDGYIYYNDGWSKYWKAYVDNKNVPIYKANFNYKGVFLKNGEHLLRFIYDPYNYRIGVLIYHIGLGIIVVVIIFIGIRIMRNNKSSNIEQN